LARILKIIAIIPVYRDIYGAIKVIKKFTKPYVDQIYIVIDNAIGTDRKQIEKVINSISIPTVIIYNNERKGIGSAIRGGINYGIQKHFDIAVVLAGNNKDNPHEIPRLLCPIIHNGFDYVQGSRFLPGGKKINSPFIRGVFSRLYPFVWSLFTRKTCTDVTNGFRAYRLSLFSDKHIDLNQEWLNDYQLEYYIHFKVLTLGYRTTEVPVSKTYMFKNRGGYSQISPFKDWWKIVGPLFYLKIRARR
jgi:dolichol-phosphate mannosyltransferase